MDKLGFRRTGPVCVLVARDVIGLFSKIPNVGSVNAPLSGVILLEQISSNHAYFVIPTVMANPRKVFLGCGMLITGMCVFFMFGYQGPCKEIYLKLHL
jgi:uncharacterized protein YqgC (DUF456 family)